MAAAKDKKSTGQKWGGISGEAVAAKTGRDWKQWCTVLDKAGARKMSHAEIAQLVADQFGIGPWWSQMVTVGYEQAKGLRKVHETSRGFAASVSRTMNVSATRLFDAWKEDGRAGWMTGKLEITTSTRPKSIRGRWKAVKVDVNFYVKSASRAQVVIQLQGLKTEAEVEKMKAHWAKCLDRLQSWLEPAPDSTAGRSGVIKRSRSSA